MYSVSNDYLTALKSPVHKYALAGVIGNKTFTQEDISMLTISNRTADDNQVSIGSVYIAEMHITFIRNLGIA